MLQNEGEEMTTIEIQEYLHLLVGDSNVKTALPNEITADEFAENILGFEEVEELEDEGIMYEQQHQDGRALDATYNAQQSGYQMHNDVIPEEDI